MISIRLAAATDLPAILAISNEAALYERLFATLRAQGYRTAHGGIAQPNEASVRLHESFGMRRVALFQRIGWKFGRWHDVGYWQLDLQATDAAPGPIRPVGEVAAS